MFIHSAWLKSFRKGSFLFVILALIITSQPGLSASQRSTAAAFPGDIGWSGNFVVNGIDQTARAVATDGKNVYVAGSFTVAGNVVANHIALWNGTNWHPLGDGMDKDVNALAVDGRGHLYAGGWFTQAGGKPAIHIARWNGQEWEALGEGVNGYVYSIIADGAGSIYVGGQFTSAGGVQANNIAKWDGTHWSALKGGIYHTRPAYGTVYSLAIDRFGFVYAGGFFDLADGKPANYVARWDGAEWNSLGDGITGELWASVYALATGLRGNLYVGGQFTSAGGVEAQNIARWNGESWSAVVNGIQSTEPFKAAVSAILVDGGVIYIGGNLSSAGGVLLNGIAKWDGNTWDNLSGGLGREKYAPVVASMAMDRDGRLFAAGYFSLAGGASANCVGLWNGVEWSGLGSDHSVNAAIQVMGSDNKGGMYVGGAFNVAGGQVVNHIVHWDGSNWTGLGGGVSGGMYGPNIRALALDKNGNLYVGGEFTQAGNVPAQNIARWTGNQWEALGSGIEGFLYSLAVDSQNNLYAAGYITSAGSVPVKNIAKWNGEQWEALGSGFDLSVKALAVDDQDRVVTGGYISNTGGISGSYLERWNGVQWETLVDRPIDDPVSIMIKGDTIYWIGGLAWKLQNGNVENIGGAIPANNVIKASFLAFAIDPEGNMVVSEGAWPYLGNEMIGILARWNGKNWESLGSGTNGVVNSLVYDQAGHLLVAGDFSQAGGKVSSYFAQWDEPYYQWMPMVNK